MSGQQGAFIWYELITSDVETAKPFYKALLGWDAAQFGNEPPYHVLTAKGEGVGGMMAIPSDPSCKDMRPGWLGYIGVEDVDKAAAAAVGAGAKQHVPPTDIPNVGRFAMLADPQGGMFYVMRGSSPEPSKAYDSAKPGHCHWNELSSSDPKAGFDFYSAQFGWTKGDTMPMGEMGDYQLFQRKGEAIGGMMKSMGMPTGWLFYFGVEDIDKAGKIATENGGVIHHGPSEVPGGAYILVIADPQGAMFGVTGPKNAA